MRGHIVRPGAARPGFTLVEVLVTLVLIALLVGVVLPSVIGQLDRGEPTRVAEDLESIRSATKMFRIDVKRYPATLEQLTEAPGASAASWDSVGDINDALIPASLYDRWSGPYLETLVSDTTDTLDTALGGRIAPVFITTTLGGSQYLTVEINGLTTSNQKILSDLIDGDTLISNDNAGGRVRNNSGTTLYLVTPINN